MSPRIRFYHPDYRPTGWDRLYDFFSIDTVPPRDAGVDYAFLDRVVERSMRALIDGVLSIDLLSADVVHVDTRMLLPLPLTARRDLCAELTRRLRFGQIGPDGRRLAVPLRWVEFREGPTAADGQTALRLLLRLHGRVDPALRTWVAASLGDSPAGAGVGRGGE